jgi:SAM-dependent methyltransferase
MPDLTPSPAEQTFFSLLAVTTRIQEILQPAIGKQFWVKAEISSGRARGGHFYCNRYALNGSTMKTEDLGNSKFVNLIFKPAGVLMGSKFRKWLMDPVKTLKIANVHPTQTILEVGCGTGFFTIPAAKMIGEQGSLIAMDASSGFLKVVAKKVEKANLKNVSIIQRDALNTRLETASIDKVLLFGVIPFPLLPLDKLLPEMHRLLKPDATMAVWLFPPLVHSWVPKAIIQTNLFDLISTKKSVYNYKRV